MGTPTAVAPNRGQLVRALRDATVALSTKTKVGTGLFVAPGLVLTCAHVVADVLESPSGSAPAAEPRRVLGEWQERPLQLELVPQWFRPGDDGGPDLALLRVRGDVPHPIACVAEAAEPGDELWAYGYPDGQYRKGDSLTFNLEGPSQRIDGAELYRAAHGRAVPGFSGSPTLNWRTGMVCGIIRLAANPAGGPPLIRLIPIGVALDTYSEALPRPDGIQGTWLNLLDDDQLRAGGSRHPGPRLRGYLTAVCHADEQRRASEDNPEAPGLLEVYQSPQLSDPAEGLVDVANAGIGERDLLVVGDPGAGKSSLLRWVRHRAAQRLLAGEQVGYVPVLLPARALAERRPTSFPDAIANAVSDELGPWLDDPPPAGTFRREPIAATPWLVLVDGFEEILTPELRQRAISALAFWSGRPNLRLLMTSRPLQEREFEPLAKKGVSRSSLAPFDLEQVRSLTTTWLALHSTESEAGDAAQRAERLVDGIQRGQIKDLARIPLVTTMLCILYAASIGEGLPQSRYDLYEQFVEALLRKQLELDALSRLRDLARRYPGGQQAVERLLDDIRTLLTAFALQRRGHDKPTGGLAEFAQTWTEDLRPRSFPVPTWAAIVMDLLRQTGLVIEDDISHQTIADFLVAQEVVGNPQDSTIIPEQAAQLGYLLSNRSLLSFVAAGWARHRPDRLRRLCEILTQRSPSHMEFLATLVEDGVEVPPDLLEQAAGTLATAANNPANNPETRVTSAAILTRLDRQRAVPRLRLLALDPRTDGSTSSLVLNERLRNLDATRILMHTDPESALAVLNVQADDPARPAERRLEAARRLLELDPARGMRALERLADAPSVPRNTRLEGLRELAQTDAARALEAAGRLARDADLAADVALVVSEFAPDRARDAVANLAADASLTPPDRVRVALRWAQLRPGTHEPRMILASLAADPSATAADRWEAVSALAEVDPAQAVPLLQGPAADRSADVSARARAVTLLSRLRPSQAGPILANLGAISGVEPQVAVDLFTAWAGISAQESIPALAAYIRAMVRGPSGDDRSEKHRCFRMLVGLLRQADPARCAAELDEIIHEPGWGTFRSQAEELWAELEPERCADHLVEVVHGRCRVRGEGQAVRDFLGSSGERGSALLTLVRMGDRRGTVLAEEILETFRPDGGYAATDLCLDAAQAITELDRDRGVDLMAELVLDRRLDGMARFVGATRLIGFDESRADETFAALARDPLGRRATCRCQSTDRCRTTVITHASMFCLSGQVTDERRAGTWRCAQATR